MDKSTYMKHNIVGYLKENSPPCPPNSTDGLYNSNNEQFTAGRSISNDYTMKMLEKPVMQHQPLQINNQLPSNKQNVQPELLKKFRQLRQWQQQQQETMFKKQHQQMENIKMQQERLQTLFKKSTVASPNTVYQSLYQCEAQEEKEMYSNKETIPVALSPLSPTDGFLRTMYNQNAPIYPVGSVTVSPIRNQSYSYAKGSQHGKNNSPILMTPMHFTTRNSFSSTSPQDNVSTITAYNAADQPKEHLDNGAESTYSPVPTKEIEVFNSDNESDYHSDTETMSGVYPLQDDIVSEAGATELEENERMDSERECDLESTICEEQNNNYKRAQAEAQTDEDRPINPGIGSSKAATFEEFLEKELKSGPSYQQVNNSPGPASPSPKKPQRTFLKKGQGLMRFRMKPTQLKKSKTSKRTSSSPQKKQTGPAKPVAEKQNDKSTSLKPAAPQIKVQRKIAGRTSQESPATMTSQSFGSSVLASRVIGPYTSLPQTLTMDRQTKSTAAMNGPSLAIMPLLSPISSLDFSFQQENKDFEETKEDEDLEEFEMLEQAAANASFSSNSSLVTKVIERARAKSIGSAEHKSGSLPTSRGSLDNIPNILSPVDTGYGSCEGRGPGSVNAASQASSIGDNVTETEASDNEDSDNDTTLKEEFELDQQPLDKLSSGEFDDEEAWGEIKAQTESTETESDNDSDDSDVTIGDPFSLTVLPSMQQLQPVGPSNPSIVSTPPASALMSKLFPKLKEKPKIQEESNAPQREKQQASPPEVTVGPSSEVQDKLKELEEEISKFRAENKALAKIRSERDEGLRRLQNEIDLFERQKTDELERIEKFKKEEMQKLKRERKVFEKYQKAAKSIPDKKEREEIEALKSQVSELQEELKRRESRWSAASSRYRNRIEALEEQNKELQEEVKLLEKYRLDQWRENETKAKDNEEARPRDVILRKTAKPVEPAQPEVLRQSIQQETINSDHPHALIQTRSPLREDKRLKDANNNNSKENSTNIPRKLEPSKQSIPPTPKIRTSDKQVAPVSEPTIRSNIENGSPNIQTKLYGLQEIEHPDGKVEQVQPDGTRVILFANGTKKEISKDGQTVIVSFFNGDIKQVFPDQRVVYHYSQAKTTHTTYPDGLEVLQFPNNQMEKHYVDGTKEIIFPDQTIKYLYVDGTEECVYADGTIQRTRGKDGEKIIEFPNGQREVHTKHFKRREYPDGTVKTVYPDGRTETRYSSGRLRVKDREGRVVMDTDHLQE